MRRYYGAELPATRTCPLSCPPPPSNGTVEPKHAGIIIRVSGFESPPPAWEVPARAGVSHRQMLPRQDRIGTCDCARSWPRHPTARLDVGCPRRLSRLLSIAE